MNGLPVGVFHFYVLMVSYQDVRGAPSKSIGCHGRKAVEFFLEGGAVISCNDLIEASFVSVPADLASWS
jgi:hypothetical protein